MSAERVVYSIQRTYIIKSVSNSEKRILTCDERIDIPTIEPLSNVTPVSFNDVPLPLTVIPCIELAGEFLLEFNLTFETNEGATVLPIKIAPGQDNPIENPYTHFRYVLALPTGATGVKSCKITHKDTGKEVQHNFTFGIMPPPYNYDNVLFGYCAFNTLALVSAIEEMLESLRLTTKTVRYGTIELPKGAGAQTISISDDELFYYAHFNYPISPEPTIHKPKIGLQGENDDFVCTLSLNKTFNVVLIDLLTGRITAYDPKSGEIIQQFMLDYNSYNTFKTVVFLNFDDIDPPTLSVITRGCGVIA